jgi:hypothetical protein
LAKGYPGTPVDIRQAYKENDEVTDHKPSIRTLITPNPKVIQAQRCS